MYINRQNNELSESKIGILKVRGFKYYFKISLIIVIVSSATKAKNS